MESLCGFFSALELLGRRVLCVSAVCRVREAGIGSGLADMSETSLSLRASWRAMQWLVAAGLQPSVHGA